ncbi:hypothetical protein K9N68_13630 [Kovacikia minuta CCNUW1]|nr:hypothetical protein [Kovacikia minuta]UBF28788.1 hypothetical protein K9N68_13630 [Kovacikia minuta CCNUW1]
MRQISHPALYPIRTVVTNKNLDRITGVEVQPYRSENDYPISRLVLGQL